MLKVMLAKGDTCSLCGLTRNECKNRFCSDNPMYRRSRPKPREEMTKYGAYAHLLKRRDKK